MPTTAKNLQNQKLCNNAFLDANMRVVNQNDFDLPNVILTRSNGRILIHCTQNMDIVLNNRKKACLINSHIEIHNITDFELQDENTSSKIYAHTITKSWNDKMDNVLQSETDLPVRPDLITTPPKETNISSFGNLFTLQDGKPHTVRIAVAGTLITMIILVTTCLLCYWRKNPNCCSRVFTTCYATCSRKQQIQKSLLIDNVLNSIKQELNSSLQPPPLEMAEFQVNPNRAGPPSPQVLEL